MVKVVFVATITPKQMQTNKAFSPAGELVQREIINGIKASSNVSRLWVASMTPRMSSLRNVLARSWTEDDEFGLAFINLPIIKHLTFSFFLIFFLLRIRPRVVFVYNASFFQTLVLILYKFISKSPVTLCGFVQDVLPVGIGFRSLQYKLDNFALKLWRNFDWVIPISWKIAYDFGLKNVLEVVKGGVTNEAIEQWELNWHDAAPHTKPYFVFAGALESYNGVDALVEAWIEQNIPYELRIFGIGSLEVRLRNKIRSNRNIILHGRVPHSDVLMACRNSFGAFCLRYSIGINAEYFFPSKFFELLVSPIPVFVNRFPGLEESLSAGCHLLNDDLSNLSTLLKDSILHIDWLAIEERKKNAKEMFLYRNSIMRIVDKLCCQAE